MPSLRRAQVCSPPALTSSMWAHRPAEHAVGQTVPHAPQFAGSVERSTHSGEEPHVAWVGGQAGR
ncbi:MAG: hypothetical protein IPF99_22600 [Deltaproteobacteria bacterium]|nr:hypothetical protein [Deltaproteobacteria bacterium]